MDAPKSDPPKLPDMVMCGDHPSFTNTELNLKDSNTDDKEKEKPKDKNLPSYAKLSPTSSRSEGPAAGAAGAARAASEHALRVAAARRRVRELERERPDLAVARPALQAAFPWAALGSFRWPPYLLAVWVLVLVLTHALHCVVGGLERALPALKKCINFFRQWTEDTWRAQIDINQKLVPVALASATALLYTLYVALYVVYGVVVWAVEPLCVDGDDARSTIDLETKVIDYIDAANSKTNSSIKQ